METLAALQASVEAEPTEAHFEALLTTYPLLFGYWLKYLAAFPDEKRWERALDQCPSIELWAAYLDRPQATLADHERAAKAVGLFFQSHPVWDRYLARLDGAERARVLAQLIALPVYEYSKYSQQAIAMQAEYPDAFGDVAQILQHTSQQVNDRWAFESQIARPYFHVVDLDAAEKKVWDDYLDYQEGVGDTEQTRVLYERCLVACALYKEFYMRYIRWLSVTTPALVDGVFARAERYIPSDELDQWTVERARYRAGLDQGDAIELLAARPGRLTSEAKRQLQGTPAPKRPGLQALRDSGDLAAFFNMDIAQNGCAEARALIKAEPIN